MIKERNKRGRHYRILGACYYYYGTYIHKKNAWEAVERIGRENYYAYAMMSKDYDLSEEEQQRHPNTKHIYTVWVSDSRETKLEFIP